jgi:hypothetical protein
VAVKRGETWGKRVKKLLVGCVKNRLFVRVSPLPLLFCFLSLSLLKPDSLLTLLAIPVLLVTIVEDDVALPPLVLSPTLVGV